MQAVYLDHAATTPVDPDVLQQMQPWFGESFGNPAGAHSSARSARDAVELARQQVANLLRVRSQEIVFTSGGTESNNTAIKGVADSCRDRGRHIITSAIEHHSVLETCKFLEQAGYEVTRLPVTPSGQVELEQLKRALRRDTILVSIMHANNEVGTVQPLAEMATLLRKHPALFHSDAVQTFGHLDVDPRKQKLDLLSLSAHKCHGPKGVGALFVRKGTTLTPLLHGGDQERGRRASTVNVPGVVGLGAAAALAAERMGEEATRLRQLGRQLIEGLRAAIPGLQLNGHPDERTPGNVHVSFPDLDGEILVAQLDRQGIACATGAACAESSTQPSHVLEAMGLSRDALKGSVRFSLGRGTALQDIEQVLGCIVMAVKRARSLGEMLD